MDGIKRKAVYAVKWNFISQILRIIFKFGIMVVLARLLTPNDFGLMAMIFVITDISYIFIDSGFNSALIQKKQVSQNEYSSVFFINLLIGLFFTLLFWNLSPYIANFYEQIKIKELTQVVSIVFFIDAFSIVQRAVLNREIAFKKLAIIDTVGNLLGGLIGISCALYGLGVWSLVWSHVFGQLIFVLLLWFSSSWRPALVFNIGAIKELWKYSFNLVSGRILNHISKRVDEIFVAKLFSANQLGLYVRARANIELPKTFIGQVVSRSFFPILSKLQDDMPNFRKLYFSILNFIVFVSAPLFIFLILAADELVGLLYGEKWLGLVYYFQLFCVVGLINVINLFKMKVINALGRPDLYLKVTLIVSPLRVLIFLFIIFISKTIEPSIFIWIHCIFAIITFLLSTFFIKKLISYNYFDEFRIANKEIVLSVGIGLFCYFFLPLLPLNEIFNLIIVTLVYFTLYLLFAYKFNFLGIKTLIKLLKF